MQMLLMQIAQSVMGLFAGMSMLGDTNIDDAQSFYDRVFAPVVDILDAMLVPILILVGTAGSIYAIVLGVNFSKAESADKREEAKKRLINVIVGLAIIIALILFLQLFISTILPAFVGPSSETPAA